MDGKKRLPSFCSDDSRSAILSIDAVDRVLSMEEAREESTRDNR